VDKVVTVVTEDGEGVEPPNLLQRAFPHTQTYEPTHIETYKDNLAPSQMVDDDVAQYLTRRGHEKRHGRTLRAGDMDRLLNLSRSERLLLSWSLYAVAAYFFLLGSAVGTRTPGIHTQTRRQRAEVRDCGNASRSCENNLLSVGCRAMCF
jgi:hypothetical protein